MRIRLSITHLPTKTVWFGKASENVSKEILSQNTQSVKEIVTTISKSESNVVHLDTDSGFVTLPQQVASQCSFEILVRDDL